jgi:serine/threonine-protein kinase
MAVWRLSTFGGLALRNADGAEPGVAAQRRALALLGLLAVAGDVGHSRDKLLSYLWPESDDEHARNALRQLLHSIRKGLGRDDVVIGTADLRLNPELITSDVQEFELALDRHELDRALQLYRGAFLDGFHLSGAPEFDLWAASMRADYAGRAAASLESLARAAKARGSVPEAAAWWRRMAALDPLDSRVAVELMQALVDAGNASGALQHARVHDALVRQELGGPPDPAVGALAERIRAAAAGPAQSTSAGSTPVAVPPTDSVPAAAPLSPAPATLSSGPTRLKLRERLQAALADRYTVERELPHREGTTRLYLARDRRHGRAVVLKVLHPSLASGIDLERFLREIALTARLSHPHIVPLLDSSEIGGQPWFAVPDLPGESLRELVLREGTLAADRGSELLADVADALDYAHRQGIVHRDVRPETILVSDGQAMVTNFGVARAIMMAADTRLTATGLLVGAPAYMSPEQAAGGEAAPASDVYSLGIVLFELLAGEPPFSGPTPHAILAKRAAASPGWETRLRCPDHVRPILGQALAKEPERRPTAAALAEALRRRAGGTSVASAEQGRFSHAVSGLVSAVAARFRGGA